MCIGALFSNNPNQYIQNMKDGAVAGFRYFDFESYEPRDGKEKKRKETAEKSSKDFVLPFHSEANVYWRLYRSGLFYRISVYI